MPSQKWCSVVGCGMFIFSTLDDFADYGWSAFKIPSKTGKLLCFCPKHQKEMQKEMIDRLERFGIKKAKK